MFDDERGKLMLVAVPSGLRELSIYPGYTFEHFRHPCETCTRTGWRSRWSRRGCLLSRQRDDFVQRVQQHFSSFYRLIFRPLVVTYSFSIFHATRTNSFSKYLNVSAITAAKFSARFPRSDLRNSGTNKKKKERQAYRVGTKKIFVTAIELQNLTFPRPA